MVSRVIYLAVRVEINNTSKEEITDEDVKTITSEVDYEFKDMRDFKLETEIYSLISPDQL